MARQSVSPTTEQAQLEALKSQTGLSDAQAQAVLAGIQENRVKLGLEGEKVGLERSGQAQKERQVKLEAAMQALGLGSQESRTEKTTREGLLEDLTRRPDINTETLASVLSAGGYPQLSTALSTQKAAAREKAITGLIPAIQSAKSDAIREKSIKPALEAQYPGAYQEAVARAFPGTAQRDYSKGGIQYFPPATGTPPAAVAPTESENPLTTLGRRLLSETTQPATRPVTTADIVAASQGNSPEQKERLFDLQRTFDSPENQAALAEQRATAPGGGTTTVGTGGDQSIGALAGSTVDRGEGGSFTVHLPSGGTARGITKLMAEDPNSIESHIARENSLVGSPPTQVAGQPTTPPVASTTSTTSPTPVAPESNLGKLLNPSQSDFSPPPQSAWEAPALGKALANTFAGTGQSAFPPRTPGTRGDFVPSAPVPTPTERQALAPFLPPPIPSTAEAPQLPGAQFVANLTAPQVQPPQAPPEGTKPSVEQLLALLNKKPVQPVAQ